MPANPKAPNCKPCKDCGQPMLNKGQIREHPEAYRHAQGGRWPVRLRRLRTR